jgi:hypothetical protein
MNQAFEKIAFRKKDFEHLKIHDGFLVNRISDDPPLSDKDLTDIATLYSKKINFWVSIFLQGKKQSTPKNTILVLKRLLKGAKPPFQFQEIRAKDLVNDLVDHRLSGGQPKQKENINERQRNKITHSQTLYHLLDNLAYAHILVKKPRIELFYRSKPDKKKKDSYYRINDEIFSIPVKFEIREKSHYDKKLKAKYDGLEDQVLKEKDKIKRFKILIEKTKINREFRIYEHRKTPKEWYYMNYLKAEREKTFYDELALQNKLELLVAIELLKERGLSDPEKTIKQLIQESE